MDRLHHVGADVEQLPVEAGLAVEHLGEVVAARECGARPLDHDCADARVRAELLERADQLAHELEAERIALLRPVQRHDGGRAVAANEQVVELRHGAFDHPSLLPFVSQSEICGAAFTIATPAIASAIPSRTIPSGVFP